MRIEYKGVVNDETAINKIVSLGLPVVIGGTGSVGGAVARKLSKNGVEDYCNCSITVDSSNGQVDFSEECPYKKFVFALGYLGAYSKDINIFKTIPGCAEVVYFTELYDAEKLSYDFYLRDKEKFDRTIELMQDDFSADSIKAFINAKINEDAAGLSPYVIRPQYFGLSIFKPLRDECFVDCGAFDGDTIRDFIHWTDGEYGKIYAFEPETDNLDKIEQFLMTADLKNVTLVRAGAYSKKTELYFKQEAEMSRIADASDTIIPADTIDSVVGDDKVTFIKMDIEGAELEALKGAEQTIKRCRPVLAISAYHRKEDLYIIPEFISNCCSEYVFYFRLHKELPIDAVLYAIPKERIIK